MIYKSLHSGFMQILLSVPTFKQLGFNKPHCPLTLSKFNASLVSLV